MVISKAEEEQMGEVGFKNLAISAQKEGRLLLPDQSRPEIRAYHYQVNRVLGKIMHATGWDKEYKWRYIIVDKPQTINAAMFPGGKMVLYTGMLKFVKSDDELASIIGHEVAHAIARHGAERYSQIMAVKLTATAIDVAVASSKKYSQYGDVIHVAFGLGAQYGILQPFSRLHENEADYIGFLVIAKAGYDPQSAIQLWERMERVQPYTQIEFFSTHPSYGTRISNLKRYLPLAMEYKGNPLNPLPTKMVIQPPPKPKPAPAPQVATSSEPKIQKPEEIPTYVEEKCDAPVWDLGDFWRFGYSGIILIKDRKEWQQKVESIEGDLYMMDVHGAEKAWRDRNKLGIVSYLTPGGEKMKSTVVVQIYFDFPLYVGKAWSRMVGDYVNEYQVTSYENVTVPAGTFKAFKIELKHRKIFGRGSGSSGRAYIWYSPKVKFYSKIMYEKTSYWASSRAQDFELVSFELKDQQPSPQEIKLER